MDQTAEVGVAAHWVYKKGKINKDTSNDLDRHMRWLRELVEVLQNEDKDPDEFFDSQCLVPYRPIHQKGQPNNNFFNTVFFDNWHYPPNIIYVLGRQKSTDR